jgi:eukaryotic-like serine/threonine-protein kinase
MTTMRQSRAVAVAVVAGIVAGGHAASQQTPQATTPLWRVAGTGSGIPVHDGDTAYFLSAGRDVAAVDVATGAVRWTSSTGVASTDAIFGTATAGTALALAGPTVVAGDWDVVGFDRGTGARRWVYEAPSGDGPGLFLGPARDGVVYTGSPGGRAYALDTGTGRLRWMTAVVDGGMTSVFRPALDGRRLAVGYSTFVNPNEGGLAMLDPETGRLRWRTEFPKARQRWQHTNLAGGPVLADDLVFGSAGDGNIYALDAETGAVRWAFPRLSGPLDSVITATDIDHRAITRAGRLIIAGSATGYVVAYNIDTRQQEWVFADRFAGSTTFALSADDRCAYVPFFGGFIVALDLVTGAERWRYGDFTQGFIWPPAPAGPRALAAAARAGFFALPSCLPEPHP